MKKITMQALRARIQLTQKWIYLGSPKGHHLFTQEVKAGKSLYRIGMKSCTNKISGVNPMKLFKALKKYTIFILTPGA